MGFISRTYISDFQLVDSALDCLSSQAHGDSDGASSEALFREVEHLVERGRKATGSTSMLT